MTTLHLSPSKAMLAAMLESITRYLLPLALLLSGNSMAELYKGTDAEGNVIYSDKPFYNSEKITPPSLTIVDAPKAQPSKEVVEEDKPEIFKYTSFKITSPVHNQTIWNEPQLMVSVQVKPELNVADGNTIWLLMDGKVLIKNSRKTVLPIGRADRGAHTLQAQIRNKKGKIIKRSKPITVHIKNTVITRPKPE
jgi:hypothetical protein